MCSVIRIGGRAHARVHVYRIAARCASSFVRTFLASGPLQVVRLCARPGLPPARARDLAFLPAHLLYRAIHKCILSFFPSVSLSLVPAAVSLLPIANVSPTRQRMHRAVSSSLLFVLSFFLPRSLPFLFPPPALSFLSLLLPPASSLPVCSPFRLFSPYLYVEF